MHTYLCAVLHDWVCSGTEAFTAEAAFAAMVPPTVDSTVVSAMMSFVLLNRHFL